MIEAPKLGDYLSSINLDKKNICRGNPEAMKAYPAFIVARSLSYHQALIPLVDQLNELRRLDNLQHYEFLLYTVPKGKRFAKWEKPSEVDDIEKVARIYDVSKDVARDYYKLMTPEQIAQIVEHFAEGGPGKKMKAK